MGSTSMNKRGPLQLQWLGLLFHEWLNRFKLYEHLFMILTALLIGVLCGFAAVLFKNLIAFFQTLFWQSWEFSLDIAETQPWWKLLLIPAAGGLLVGPITRFFAPEAKGHGVPEVMAAVARNNGIMRVRVVLAKAVASAITLASGGSAGREGPIIQIGSAIGSVVGQVLKIGGRRLRVFVGCGAAAGIASTFNAPIAGTLFAVEVILGEFGVLQFSPIVIAAVTATVISRSYWGDDPVFTVPEYDMIHSIEMIPYTMLGIVCGVMSVVYIRTLYRAEDTFDSLKRIPSWLRPAAGGLLVGAIAMFLPHVMGDGYSTVDLALLDKVPWFFLILLLALKILATSFTLGSGGSGGVFAPSLFIGAMTGGLVGHAAQAIMGESAGMTGGYALAGMGGLVAGTMHSPITAILIIFELTNNYEIILPLMTVCIISTLVSSRLSRESIYTLKLVRKGIDVFQGRSLDIFKNRSIQECVTPDIMTATAGENALEVMQQMIQSEKDHLYVTSEDHELIGVVSLSDLKQVLLHREQLAHGFLAEDLANESVPFCMASEKLSDAMIRFEVTNQPELPVIDNAGSRKLLGVVRYRDVIQLYNDEIIKQDSADGLIRRFSSMDRVPRVRIVEGFSLKEWIPPRDYWHKSLEEAQLPLRHGVYVMLVKTRHGEDVMPVIPDRYYRITPDDTLIVCGKDQKLDELPVASSS